MSQDTGTKPKQDKSVDIIKQIMYVLVSDSEQKRVLDLPEFLITDKGVSPSF